MARSGDSKKRSILKSITYRLICIISLVTVTYIITGDVVESSLITIVFQAIQTVLYYLHERGWERAWPT